MKSMNFRKNLYIFPSEQSKVLYPTQGLQNERDRRAPARRDNVMCYTSARRDNVMCYTPARRDNVMCYTSARRDNDRRDGCRAAGTYFVIFSLVSITFFNLF